MRLLLHTLLVVAVTEAINAPRRLPSVGLDHRDDPLSNHDSSRNKRLLRGRALQGNTDVLAGELAEAEVMIDVNPTDPDNLVICGHEPGFDNMGTWYSTDGGATWTATQVGNAEDGLTSGFRFDPWCLFASNGDVFVGYGAEINTGTLQTSVMVCRSTDGGATYATCTEVSRTPKRGSLPGNDKWSMAAGPDPVVNGQENIYIAWTQNPASGGQNIVLSRSINNGVSF